MNGAITCRGLIFVFCLHSVCGASPPTTAQSTQWRGCCLQRQCASCPRPAGECVGVSSSVLLWCAFLLAFRFHLSFYETVINHSTGVVEMKSKHEKGFIGFQRRRKLVDKIVEWKLVSVIMALSFRETQIVHVAGLIWGSWCNGSVVWRCNASLPF